MADRKKTSCNDDVLQMVATHVRQLPDKTRLNFALTNTRSFSLVYPELLEDNVRAHHTLTVGDPLYRDRTLGTSALVFAIESSDVNLLDKCLDTIGFWDWPCDSERELFDSYCLGSWRLEKACAYAGSLESLKYFKEKHGQLAATRGDFLFSGNANDWHFSDYEIEGELRFHHHHLTEFISNECWLEFFWDNRKYLQYMDADFEDFQMNHGLSLERSVRLRDEELRLKVTTDDVDPLCFLWTGEGVSNEFRLSDTQAVGMLGIFDDMVKDHLAVCENPDWVRKQVEVAYRELLREQCEDHFKTSRPLIAAAITNGNLDINQIFKDLTFRKFSSDHKAYAPIDIAASTLNIKALRILLDLGAKAGGARSLADSGDRNDAQIPSPLWRLFNAKIYIDPHNLHWHRSIDCVQRRHFGWHRLALSKVDTDILSGVRTDNFHYDDPILDRNEVVTSLWSLDRLCNCIGDMTEILLEHDSDFQDLYELKTKLSRLHPRHKLDLKLSPLHPMSKLLDLTRRILRATSIYHERRLPLIFNDGHLTVKIVHRTERSEINECLGGLGRAFDLLMNADPALQTVDELLPSSTSTGLARLLEVVRPEDSIVSMRSIIEKASKELCDFVLEDGY